MTAKIEKVHKHLNMQGLIIHQAQVESLTEDPATTYPRIYFNTTTQRWRAYDPVAAAWSDLGPDNVKVQNVNPGFTAPGLWIQTGLGPLGEDMTFWVEDGT